MCLVGLAIFVPDQTPSMLPVFTAPTLYDPVKDWPSLEKVKGVSSTEVDLDKGLVTVGYETKDVKPEALAENIRNAGYDCTVQEVLSPEQYKKVSGQDINKAASVKSGCCAGKDTQVSAKKGCCGDKADCGMKENRMPCNK